MHLNCLNSTLLGFRLSTSQYQQFTPAFDPKIVVKALFGIEVATKRAAAHWVGQDSS
jgi:hypothetical protein